MNIEELKRLAEAATPDQWVEGDGYAGISVGKRPIVQAYGESRTEAIGNMRYILAAQPSAILELIRQRDELLEALKIFGRHERNCIQKMCSGFANCCTCGLSDIVDKAEADHES